MVEYRCPYCNYLYMSIGWTDLYPVPDRLTCRECRRVYSIVNGIGEPIEGEKEKTMEKISIAIQSYSTEYEANNLATITIRYVVRVLPKRITPETFREILDYLLDQKIEIETDSLQKQLYGIVYPEDETNNN